MTALLYEEDLGRRYGDASQIFDYLNAIQGGASVPLYRKGEYGSDALIGEFKYENGGVYPQGVTDLTHCSASKTGTILSGSDDEYELNPGHNMPASGTLRGWNIVAGTYTVDVSFTVSGDSLSLGASVALLANDRVWTLGIHELEIGPSDPVRPDAGCDLYFSGTDLKWNGTGKIILGDLQVSVNSSPVSGFADIEQVYRGLALGADLLGANAASLENNEDSTTGWTPKSDATITSVASEKFGDFMLRITASTTTTARGELIPDPDPQPAGAIHHFSGWARGSNADGAIAGFTGVTDTPDLPMVGNIWREFSFQITCDGTANRFRFYARQAAGADLDYLDLSGVKWRECYT
jgi:hypothetical protein